MCASDIGWKTEKVECDYFVEPISLSEEESKILEKLIEKYEAHSEKDKTEKRGEISKKLKELLVKLCESENIAIGKKEFSKIVEVAEMNVGGYGVLDYLLGDDELEEISVIGANKPIYVFHRDKGWLKTNAYITTKKFGINIVNKMARVLGRRLTYQNPRLNASLPDNSRLHASIDPLTLNGIEITIRKFKRNPLSIIDLIRNKTISARAAAFLWAALFGNASVLIGGNTGSGKTTTLNAIFSFIPLRDRIIITEETPEINIPHEHIVRLLSNEELNIKMNDIVEDTLRMRPDRVIVGEVRSREEVKALFNSLLAGQARGAYATMHAESSEEAVTRLISMGVAPEEINAIDLIVIQRRIPIYEEKTKTQREIRRITEISEMENGKARKIFEWDAKKDELKEANKPKIAAKMAATYQINEKELGKLVKKREKLLLEHLDKKMDYYALTEEINREIFGE